MALRLYFKAQWFVAVTPRGRMSPDRIGYRTAEVSNEEPVCSEHQRPNELGAAVLSSP